MSTLSPSMVNFGIVEDTDEYLECQCHTIYRVFPRANAGRWPHGYAAPVLIGDDGKYQFAGTLEALSPEPDDGVQFYRRVRWNCPCGVVCSYVEPLFKQVDCTMCEKAALHRQIVKPTDLYTNRRYGMACDCCGHQGTHTVRRDGEYLPRCLS